jgi:rhamnosyltransferase
MEVPMISVVVRTLDEERHLGALLTSVAAQEGCPQDVEVVVVDSGSSDATLEIAKAHEARITHIAREEFSFGRSLNVGCDFAAGDVLVFVSGHCVPTSTGWLAALVAPILDGRAEYAYGRQVAGDATKLSERRLFDKHFPATSQLPQPGFFCNNANAALARTAWERHRFDEELTGLEDMALARRLVEAGGAVAYVAEAAVHHVHDETWAQVRRRYEREAIALRRIMPEVQLSPADVVRYVAAGVAGDAWAALREGRLRAELGGLVAFRAAQYWGSYVGGREHRRTARQLKDVYYYPAG